MITVRTEYEYPKQHTTCARCGDPAQMMIQGLDRKWFWACNPCHALLYDLLEQLPFPPEQCAPGNDSEHIVHIVINAFFNYFEYEHIGGAK